MGKTILVVEDNPDILDLLKDRLEFEKYAVLTATNGQDGLEKARKEKPDLIILDLMLPLIDGYKVCGLLKADTRYNKIPIIILTARGQDSDKEMGKEAGADAFLNKPFEPQTMLGEIKKLLKE